MKQNTYKEAMNHWRMKRISRMLKMKRKGYTLARIGREHGLSRQRVFAILKSAEQVPG